MITSYRTRQRRMLQAERAEAIRCQVRAEIAAAEAREQGGSALVEAVEVEAVEAPRPVRPAGYRMNRHQRRVARLRGCLAAYTAGGPPEHEPAECDGTCRQATPDDQRGVWRALVLLFVVEYRRSGRAPGGCGELHRCDCGAHDWHNSPVAAGWRSLLTAEQLAAHDAYFARELRAWQSLVWLPEAAEERAEIRQAGLRKIAAMAGSAWSRLRAQLAALGVLRDALADADPHRALARWLEVCPHTGPPAAATVARWSTLRTAAHGMGAPVIGP